MPVTLVSQRSTSEFRELAPEGQNQPWRPGGCLLQEHDLKCSHSSSQLFTPLTGSERDIRGTIYIREYKIYKRKPEPSKAAEQNTLLLQGL